MSWEELTAPAVKVITTDEFKQHGRVSTTADDSYIDLLVEAAMRSLEKRAGLALINRTFRAYWDDFPDSDELKVPVAPLVTVVSVKYYDTDGVLQTWAAANYGMDTKRQPGRLTLGYGIVWPTVQFERPNAVQIDFTAGHGTAAANVPGPLRTAVLWLAEHWYDTRVPVNIGNIVNEIPKTFDYMIDPYKVLAVG